MVCFLGYIILLQGYEDTNHFNVRYKPFSNTEIGDREIFRMKAKKTFKERCEGMIEILKGLEGEKFDILKEIEDFVLIIDVFQKLGCDIFVEKNYSRAELKTALEIYDIEELRFSPEVLKEIKEAFPLKVKIEKRNIKTELEAIYKRYEIKCKVYQNTIEQYYNASPSNGKPPTYRLTSWKL